MCRWLSYRGPEIFLEDLLYTPKHSLIDQSLQADEAKTTTNGDGFGLGWYGAHTDPGTYHEVLPAWNDPNLRTLARQIKSPNFFAHVRASTGTATSRSNCHPFTASNWLFMHNGQIGGYRQLRRTIESLIPDQWYLHRQGSTDSEAIFYIMLAKGLNENPIQAATETIVDILQLMQQQGIKKPFRMTAAFTDGPRYYALRYSSDSQPPSLYYQRKGKGLIVMSEPMYGENHSFKKVPPNSMLIATGDQAPEIRALALGD